jgi:AraC-like DNA-binding protein
MVFRAGEIKRALLPFSYFLLIALAFFLDLAINFIGDISVYYSVFQWFVWFMGPCFVTLLIVQIAQIRRVPALYNYWVLLLIPLALTVSTLVTKGAEGCSMPMQCEAVYFEWLTISGLFAGGLSLLSLWFHRNMLGDVYKQKEGKDRYWLILTLVIVNISLLIVMFASLSSFFSQQDVVLVRNILGLGMVYLASTSLFRIYPQGLSMVERGFTRKAADLSDVELSMAKNIESLLDLDKIYQDPQYSRADLAQEVGSSEATVSKIINVYFKKSFPQILNERRVEDAKRLLVQTDASVRVVSSEVGFNSTASFNRVFKDIVGQPPTSYRKENKRDALIGKKI